MPVLIETYWNVKGSQKPHLNCRIHVLIETYWNVKAWVDSRVGTRSPGINRNILECKERSRIGFRLLNNVLIETYWNVKIYTREIYYDNDGCINRNILECKEETEDPEETEKESINRNILECKVFCSNLFGRFRIIVLIETYWNVKKLQPYRSRVHNCINRNILECKVLC